MNWSKIEAFLTSGQAFIPVNIENKGDSIEFYMKDGTIEILDIPCDKFLKMLLYYFGTSISANKRRYGKLVGKTKLVPIVLSYGITLVPYFVRESIGHQTRIGWFIAKEISGFAKESSHKTIIQFMNHEVSVFHSEKFCFEQLKNARCMELCFGEIHEPHRKNWLFSTG
ncbi:hypothetical protein F7731_26170 [Cytobacillus depressus]|uniref:Uncharacterized protein n=1 Tax=Cytobacillus depressus TaxID=1602942 RepID=A0A6L3UYJ3_9BACI|nr:competence protein ComK [Cytobacillus depressus]KAB2328007.1 hypothetical protein F7731_26170 [Cytobacillus depressus]